VVSQENLEIVRHASEAFARRGIEAMIEYAAPDCVFYPDPSWMEDREYRGREAFIAFTKTQTDAFGDFRIEVHDIRPVGDRLLALTEFVGQASASGVAVRQQAAHVFSDFHDARSGMTGPFSVGTRRAKLWGSRTRRHGGEWLL
jgi:ketosteroid isomerase-like protein